MEKALLSGAFSIFAQLRIKNASSKLYRTFSDTLILNS